MVFAGVYSVLGVTPRTEHGKSWYQYATTEIHGIDHLIGRVLVTFLKNFRASYLRGDRYGKEFIVSEIRRERLSVSDFPGYNSVLLSQHVLRTVVREEIPSWRSALRSVSGVYVIVDTITGKQYVGSACGGDGIWQRWEAYASNGHGGNKELKVLLHENGADYANNFQYSILEVSDLSSSQEHITARESHWKDVLCSRKFGYNHN